MAKICTVEGCATKVLARDLCSKHYQRKWAGKADITVGKFGTAESRFWKRVQKRGPNECWEVRDKYKRYATMSLGDGGPRIGVHRYSYTLHHGPIPAGMLVMHTCDVPTCCNPAHLRVGTPKENMDDMSAKGRRVTGAARGTESHMAVLTEAKVRYIKAHPEISHVELAQKFDVVPNTIRAIRIGRSWAHIK